MVSQNLGFSLVLLFLFFFRSCRGSGAQVHRFETCRESSVLRSTPLCDPSKSAHIRASDLVNRLTLEEKVLLIDETTWEGGIPRLQLGPFNWQQEGLHGIAYCNLTDWKVTSFPQVINLGRTFDFPLIHEMGVAISDEGRALSNVFAIDTSFWAPNLNIFRDPRWGRGQETPGEDPWLTSRYAYEYITGMQQGESFPKYLKVISGTKHYTAYDLENWHGVNRHEFNAIVSQLDLEETFLPPFKAAVKDGGVAQLMCAYNSVNGVPNCADKKLLEDVLRGEWGFDGNVVSDCGAIRDIQMFHNFTKTPEEAVQAGLLAGTDLDCGYFYQQFTVSGVKEGVVNESLVDIAVTRLIRNRVRLGEFDPWEDQPYRKITKDVISSKAHQQLAYTLAQESMVLLKNLNDVLPLDAATLQRVGIIGPNGKATGTLQGDYAGPAPYVISPLEGVQTFSKQAAYVKGCGISSQSTSDFPEAIALAKQSDAVIMVMGLDCSLESEGKDRDDISYPGVQLELIQEVSSALKGTGKPVIVVNTGGGPIDTSWVRDSPDVHALMEAGYPSQAAGQAMADVIFGAISPAGRLTMTVYPADYVNQVSFFDMEMRPSSVSPGRTYKFYKNTPVFAFGDGLSFTSWKYDWYDTRDPNEIPLLLTIHRDQLTLLREQHLAVNVTNTGSKWAADDVVLAFITNENGDIAAPILPKRQLFGAERLKGVKPGETRTVKFHLTVDFFQRVGIDGTRDLLLGSYLVTVGQDELTGRIEVVV